MRILSLSLENIKSFEKVENLEFSDINIFIGNNNSGKSTLLKAILCPHSLLNYEALRKGEVSGYIKLTVNNSELKHLPKENNIEIIDRFETNNSFLQIKANGSNFQNLPFFGQHRSQTKYIPFLSDRHRNNYTLPISADQIENIFFDYSNIPNLVDHLSNDQIEEQLLFDEYCKAVLNFPIRASAINGGKMAAKTISSNIRILLTEMGYGVAHIIAIGAKLALAKNSVFIFDQVETDLHPNAIKSICHFIKKSALQNKNQFFLRPIHMLF